MNVGISIFNFQLAIQLSSFESSIVWGGFELEKKSIFIKAILYMIFIIVDFSIFFIYFLVSQRTTLEKKVAEWVEILNFINLRRTAHEEIKCRSLKHYPV